MPPTTLPSRDLRNLVRKLGASARPSQQRAALEVIGQLCEEGYDDDLVVIAAAGAITPLVQLLGAGTSTDMQEEAASALWELAMND
ncbi:hypothetical protein FOA52_015252 [Chlamydomonas sp. UWO 241]|nr:hypothetical protein FOA52_015252 [Chlamydomonas sp. UWO 241]